MDLRRQGRAILCATAALAWLLPAQPLGAQDSIAPSGAAAAIRISGAVQRPLTVSAADLEAMPRRTVRAAEHDQPASTYDGVALRDVLARAGVAFGPALRGPALATYVLCTAADGYQVVFALAELDSAFSDRTIIVADHRDGKSLDSHAGPFRVVVPGDARPARWIRQLTELTVVRAAEHSASRP
jgi:DMSO/TMAO reductase YedYZ molybdopterin-dependent catalytic subunit